MGVGISSVLLIFVVLCMVTFAILSVVSANADYKLSEKLVEHTEEYYVACNTAEAMLADIDEILLDAYQNTDDASAYLAYIAEKLKTQSTVTWKKPQLSYEVSINEGQSLQVVLDIVYPQKKGESFYEISGWKVISVKEWTPDNHVNVYQK
jgi:hypothetical protein